LTLDARNDSCENSRSMSDAAASLRKTVWALALLGACLTVPAAEQPGDSARAAEQPKATPAHAAEQPKGTPAQQAKATPAEAAKPTAAQAAKPPNATPAAAAPLPLKPAQILSLVSRTVDWYHGLQSVEQFQGTQQDLLARDRLQDQSLTAVRLAFDFGHGCAAILSQSAQPGNGSSTPASSTGFTGQLDQMTDRVAQRATMLQSQLSDLDAQLAHSSGTERATLAAQRGDVVAALALVREVQSSIQDMERFESDALLGDSSGEGGLGAQITALQKSVPEAARSTSASTASAGAPGSNSSGSRGAKSSSGGAASASGGASASPAAPGSSSAAAAAAFHPESAGAIALVAEWFSVHGTRQKLNAAFKQTGSLLEGVNDQRGAITGAVRNVLRDAFASTTSADPAQLTAQKAVLEAGAAQFKKLSSVIVPLGEEALTLESAQSTLREWNNQVGVLSANVSQYLALRIGFLLASIGVVLVVSEVWRRATFRYLHDVRRRRQFLLLRRVAVGIALTVVIVFGLVSEIGSIATYAGFVTAGIAVALQNVILAVVGYFFLIGRHGVRVGDRITLAGVTGRVVDIGLVRIYLMELSGPELHSTGRIVVLSNAVLFQPQALFKQIPGAEYTWHTITLTLAANSDVAEASKRLQAAANSVYAKYQHMIERQYAVMQRLLDFETSTPQPEVRVRWAESGLQCSVRYPVEPEDSATVDQQMLKALREALAKDPPLTLLSTEPVAVKPSDS
jgi:small-conductance mechanosensitive channel